MSARPSASQDWCRKQAPFPLVQIYVLTQDAEAIRNLLDREKVDVLCLQETKLQTKGLAAIEEQLALMGWHVYVGQPSSAGEASGHSSLVRAHLGCRRRLSSTGRCQALNACVGAAQQQCSEVAVICRWMLMQLSKLGHRWQAVSSSRAAEHPPHATAAGAVLEWMLMQEAAQIPVLLAVLVTRRAAGSDVSGQVCLQHRPLQVQHGAGLLHWPPTQAACSRDMCHATDCRQKPLRVQYGIGQEELDEEGRVITAEYQDYRHVLCS